MMLDRQFSEQFKCKKCGCKKFIMIRRQKNHIMYRILICKECWKKHLHKEPLMKNLTI